MSTGFYRELKEGETTQNGDERLALDGRWFPFTSTGSTVTRDHCYRRPIPEPERQVTASPALSEPYGTPQPKNPHAHPTAHIIPAPYNTQHPNDPKGAAGAIKCPMHLLPAAALQETAWVHGFGAARYGPWNWRESKVNATTYVAAIMRHLDAWREGEDLDPESGRSHLAHIAASVNILLDSQTHGCLIDDRAKAP
jgi:hypothetical protein